MNKDNYHEQGNIIIMLLLLPLGHISNRIRIHLFNLRLLPPLPIHLSRTQAPAPKSALPSSIFSSNVRSGRQVDGLLRYGGSSKKVKESRILVQGHPASAS